MLKQSENIVHRLFQRETSSRRPGTQLHKVRTFYENIVPNHTLYDVECPDHTFRKFTNDGQYLIAFSRTFQHLIVYRFHWMSYCNSSTEGDNGGCEEVHLPPIRSKRFESFFTQLYCVALASGSETICKDFFLTTDNGLYGLFATSTGLDAVSSSSTSAAAVPGVPSMERIRIIVVRLADGVITDDRIFHDDFIHLSHNMGVFMYEDLLAILSVRYQCIHILQIRDTGTFVDVRRLGDFCQEDDELLISSQAQREVWYHNTQSALRKPKDSAAEPDLSSIEFELDKNLQQRLHENRSSEEPVERSGFESSHHPVSGVYATDADVHFEGYFRGLLGEASSAAGPSSSEGITERNSLTNRIQLPLTLNLNIAEGGRSDHSVNNENNLSRAEYIITSRHDAAGARYEAFGHVGEDHSTGATSSEILLRSGMQTPVSSSGSRHLSGRTVLEATNLSESTYQQSMVDQLDHHRNAAAATFQINNAGGPRGSAYSRSTAAEGTLNNLTSTTTSRTDINLPRSVPFASRVGEFRSPQEAQDHLQPPQQNTGPQARVLCGIKQRLLSFIFRSVYEQDSDPLLQRAQRLKRFHYHFQHYVELVMWKVQFLDRRHLLIKFGSADGVVSRSCDASQQPAFFVVYNFETTQILEFQQNSSEEFLQLFENFADHFRAPQRYPVFMNYVTSYSNNIHVREQIREQKAACISSKASSKANSYAQIARRTLASLPINSQSQSPSVYFDHSLFHFDEKLISATDRHKPSLEHPIKFISRRRPHTLKFKINPGPEHGTNDTRMKGVAAFVFHPIFPFAISIQQSYMQASVVNFHFRK